MRQIKDTLFYIPCQLLPTQHALRNYCNLDTALLLADLYVSVMRHQYIKSFDLVSQPCGSNWPGVCTDVCLPMLEPCLGS